MKDQLKKLEELTESMAQSRAAMEEQVSTVAARSEENATKLEAMQTQVNEASRNLSMPGLEDHNDIKQYSLVRAIRGNAMGNMEKESPLEHRLSEELKQRTMSFGTNSEGGFLVPEEVVAQFYDLYRPQSVMGLLGVTSLTPAGSPVRINKSTASTTAARATEGAAGAASDMTFAQVTLTPNKVTARTVVSRENTMWSDPTVDAIVARDLMRSIMLKQDLDMLEGSGTAPTPEGVKNATGIGSKAFGGVAAAAYTYQALLDLNGVLEDANVPDDGTIAYVSKPGVFRNILKEQIAGSAAGDGAYVIAPGTTVDTLLQFPKATTTQLSDGVDTSATTLYLGRWSDVVHARFGGLEIRTSDTASDGTNHAFTQGWIHIVANAWDDVGVIRPASFVIDNTAKFD